VLKADGDSVPTFSNVGIDCFFLTNMNKEQNQFTLNVPYQPAKGLLIEQTETLDIASIPDNDFVFTTFTMTGAVVGDEITMIAPVAFNALEIVTSVYVSDADEITVKCGNFSGGAINPASGDFKFKIQR